MDYICGFFDVQGFYCENVFFPREAAIAGDKTVVHLSINNELTLAKLTSKEQKCVSYLSNFHHGLDLSAAKNTGVTIEELKVTLQTFYNFASNTDKYLIAVKSCEAEKILRDLGIHRINVLDYGGTSKEIDDGKQAPCHLHTVSKKPGTKCALNIVIMLQKWYSSGRWGFNNFANRNKNNYIDTSIY